MRTKRSAALAAATLILLSVPAATAAFGGYGLSGPTTVSTSNPLASCTVGADPAADPPSVNYDDTEVEPFVAVNPLNSANVVGTYQQDRWNDGGAHGLTTAWSNDGGASWARVSVPFSKCNDPSLPYNRATDPWVSFDSAGRAYQIALSIDSASLGLSAILASSTTDADANVGGSWSTPVTIQVDTNPVTFNDKESITGDWRSGEGAGKAYATWIRGNLPGLEHISPVGAFNSFAYGGLPMFSKTVDGGQTWSEPKPMTNQVVFVQGNQIAVLPDGTLVNIGAMLFRGSGIQPTPTQYFWTALRSKDGGKTWGAPIKVAPLGTALLTNPDIPEPTSFDETVRAGDYLPDVAVDHETGALYMVFANHIGGGINHVMLTKSTDGGKRWSTPIDVTDTPDTTHSFNGSVEVTADGTVAVTYYDFRSNDTSTDGLPTDVWLTHSHDGGATWSAGQHVYGAFDMENAPVARGWFLGDYQGLAAMGNGLAMFFSVATGADDSADVVFVRGAAPS